MSQDSALLCVLWRVEEESERTAPNSFGRSSSRVTCARICSAETCTEDGSQQFGCRYRRRRPSEVISSRLRVSAHANEREQTYEDPGGADTTDGTSPNELHDAVRSAADRRSDLEECDAGEEHPFRWVDPQDLTEPEDEGGLGQDEATRHPSLLVERVEVGGDPRQRRGENRLVERDEKN